MRRRGGWQRGRLGQRGSWDRRIDPGASAVVPTLRAHLVLLQGSLQHPSRGGQVLPIHHQEVGGEGQVRIKSRTAIKKSVFERIVSLTKGQIACGSTYLLTGQLETLYVPWRMCSDRAIFLPSSLLQISVIHSCFSTLGCGFLIAVKNGGRLSSFWTET